MKTKLFIDDDTSGLLQSIKAERLKRGLTQRQLAFCLKIASSGNLSRYENGKKVPGLNTFFKLAEFFGWDISNNINFLFLKYKNNPKKFRKIRQSYALSDRELYNLTFLRASYWYKFFMGKGSVRAFVLIQNILNEEKRLDEFRKKFIRPTKNRKKVLS